VSDYLDGLRIKFFADGADPETIAAQGADPRIRGFTTNPTLMRKAGIDDYERFAHEVLALVGDRPVSFEVFADDLDEMERQAKTLASWGPHVFVKIPVTDPAGSPSTELLARLADDGVQVNVTAILTLAQVASVLEVLRDGPRCVVSVFAGRIADAGVDPVPLMASAVELVRATPNAELLWASPREVLNVVQADVIGCDIITMTEDLLAKLPLLGHDLTQFSLETVQMFHRDAAAAGYDI
jgi:transaldolase